MIFMKSASNSKGKKDKHKTSQFKQINTKNITDSKDE